MNLREYIEHEVKEAVRKLAVLKELLEAQGLKVQQNLSNTDDPFLYVHSTVKDLPFEGVRLYEIGKQLAFRVQKQADKHPHGKAYALPVEKIYEDLLSDEHGSTKNENELGEVLAKSIADEFRSFFQKSKDALNQLPPKSGPENIVFVRGLSSDYGQGNPNAV